MSQRRYTARQRHPADEQPQGTKLTLRPWGSSTLTWMNWAWMACRVGWPCICTR